MSYYIYKICCDDLPEFIYIGSTKAFRQRKNDHKKTYNKGDTKKLYNTIRENGGWDNWRMVILEELGEVSFTEARIKEEEYRVKLNANMNSQKCYLTEEQKKEYYENNKEKIKEKGKEYRENNKEKIKERKNNFYHNNKEEILKYNKEWRENNKEQIKEWKSKKVTCECGCLITRSHINRHKKSKKHLELMKHLEKI